MARFCSALQRFIETCGQLSAAWIDALAPHGHGADEELRLSLAEIQATMPGAGLEALSLAVESPNGFEVIDGEPVLAGSGTQVSSIAGELLRLSESMCAKSILSIRGEIDEASRVILELNSEVLLGQATILPALAPTQSASALTFDDLPLGLVQRAQLLLHEASRFVAQPSRESAEAVSSIETNEDSPAQGPGGTRFFSRFDGDANASGGSTG
jgi:hypothetical protein